LTPYPRKEKPNPKKAKPSPEKPKKPIRKKRIKSPLSEENRLMNESKSVKPKPSPKSKMSVKN
jgi:hypothetical protein